MLFLRRLSKCEFVSHQFLLPVFGDEVGARFCEADLVLHTHLECNDARVKFFRDCVECSFSTHLLDEWFEGVESLEAGQMLDKTEVCIYGAGH